MHTGNDKEPDETEVPLELDSQFALRDALLAGVGAAAVQLTEVSEKMLERARWTRWQRTFVLSSVCFMIAMMIGLIVIGLSNRHTGQAIESCTSPTGSCYKDSVNRQAAAVSQIVQYELAASWCSSHSSTFSDAQQCMMKLASIPARP